jgi:hypothetical protein
MPGAVEQALGHLRENEKAQSLRGETRFGGQHDRRRTAARGGVGRRADHDPRAEDQRPQAKHDKGQAAHDCAQRETGLRGAVEPRQGETFERLGIAPRNEVRRDGVRDEPAEQRQALDSTQAAVAP